jgi:parallel beta-helix repeat protein
MDFITVNGATSAAVFDHLDITSCHCAFHFNQGNGITISNSNIHANAYGLMVEGSANNKITHNNFTANNPNIGDCGNGSSATVSDNYFQGPAFAANCPKLMSMTPAAAAYPTTGAGAVGPQP